MTTSSHRHCCRAYNTNGGGRGPASNARPERTYELLVYAPSREDGGRIWEVLSLNGRPYAQGVIREPFTTAEQEYLRALEDSDGDWDALCAAVEFTSMASRAPWPRRATVVLDGAEPAAQHRWLKVGEGMMWAALLVALIAFALGPLCAGVTVAGLFGAAMLSGGAR